MILYTTIIIRNIRNISYGINFPKNFLIFTITIYFVQVIECSSASKVPTFYPLTLTSLKRSKIEIILMICFQNVYKISKRSVPD